MIAARSSAGGGATQVAELARDLYRMGPAGRRALGSRFRDIGQPVLQDAQARASWSSRIPSALSVRANVRDTRIGIELRAAAAAAPHARSYEGLGGGGQFRHPVFGNRDNWVPQATRPFALPAVLANEGRAAEACAAAYEDAAREVGFR